MVCRIRKKIKTGDFKLFLDANLKKNLQAYLCGGVKHRPSGAYSTASVGTRGKEGIVGIKRKKFSGRVKKNFTNGKVGGRVRW
ncbi:MAG: hypothetical protein PF487_01230 [Bacteroidales bacterium]|jgi:hypothetical protein|nr:hypothetical protein [Bacteroidales bacterium]